MPGALTRWEPFAELGELRRERRYGSFHRSMALPAGVDAKKIKAKTHDGVVEVKIPLPKEPEKQAVTITPTAG
jgi:HSP20 family protein